MFCGVQPFSDKVTFFSENNSEGEPPLSSLYFESCLAVLKRAVFPGNDNRQGGFDMMKSAKAAMLAAAMIAMGASAHAAQTPSVALGEKLFNDPKLGGATGTKTCASCHPDGAGVEFSYKKPNLPQIINMCIARGLNGIPLPLDSVEMKSLILYHQSLK
jgi:cytochrome c peroxidase